MAGADLTQTRILVVDDEPANVRLLERMLAEAGYQQVRSTTDSRQVLALYGEHQPDLILLDLMMPHLDGIAVIRQLRIPEDVFLPILVLTADATIEAKKRALEAGAKDFLTKPFDRLEVLLRIKNLLDTRTLYLDLERHNRELERIVAERTQRLLQSEKVATMGSLLAGVAHELNNPLAVVMGQAHLLRGSAKEPAMVERAEKITAGAERCARIVRNFLALARQRSPEREDVYLNLVVQQAVELLAYHLRTSNVEVAFDLADDLPVIWADGHQLHQVVVNLVANAHQAMRRMDTARRLVITTRFEREPDRVQLDIADSLAEALQGDGHQVEVAADGAKALEMLGRRAFDLIVTDTKMPVLDGERFYAELEQRFPKLCRRILFLTGDVLSGEKRAFLERTGAPHLLKPFDLREVRQLVHRMLAEAVTGAPPERVPGLR